MKIETWTENQILRARSEEISRIELNKYVKIWKQMIDYIKNPENNWVWLAAPQIWVNKRLVVVSLLNDYSDTYFNTVMMINPEILEYSEETDMDTEWCLSVPWKQAEIERALKIKLSYLDNKWRKITVNLEWLSARIVQHELDHLNWILLIDRINKNLPVNAQSK